MKKLLPIVVLFLIFSFCYSLNAQEKKGFVAPEDSVEIELSVSGNLVKIKNATIGKYLNIYSVVGKKIDSVEIKSANEECTLNVPKGLYILKIESTIRKVVIK